MADPMTKERIEALRALCEKATPGPWWWCDTGLWPIKGEPVIWTENVPGGDKPQWAQRLGQTGEEMQAKADADFIASTRTALPEALDEIERLRAENERLAYGKGLADMIAPLHIEAQRLRAALAYYANLNNEADSGEIARAALQV